MTKVNTSHWREYLTTFCATLITATAGTCMGWASPTMPKLLAEDSVIPITPDQSSWIVSVMILCSVIAPIPSAYMADRFGRKTTLLIGAIPFIIGWVLVLFAKSFTVLMISRFFSGLGYGIVYTVSPMYTGEIATNEVRGACSTLITLMNKLGILTQYCIGPFISVRRMGVINLLLPITFIMTFVWLPESPYFYVQKERMKDAHKSLSRLREGDVKNELKTIEITVNEDMQNRGRWIDLIKNPGNRTALWMNLALFTIQQWCGSAAVVSYSQIIFSKTKSELKDYEQSIILGCVQLATAATSLLLVDRLGRKPLLIASSLGCGLMTAVIGTYFFLTSFNEYEYFMDSITWLPIVAILTYIIAYTIGLSTVPYVTISEMFPSNIKSYANCVGHMYTGVSMFAVTKLFQVIADKFGIYYVFWGFSFFSLIGLVVIHLYLPETKGKSFAAIQSQLRSGSKSSKHDRSNNLSDVEL